MDATADTSTSNNEYVDHSWIPVVPKKEVQKQAQTPTDVQNEYVDPDWIVVLPRRKKKKIPSRAPIPAKEVQQQAWAPADVEHDTDRETKLTQKMQNCLGKLQTSKFYQLFLDQIQSPEVSACFSRVLGSDLKMNMVIYGIGSIESFEAPRLQLSLAILMKRNLDWIGDIEVFDPVLSATETRVMESMGCRVMSVNEQGRRQILKPTLFFMPHCEAVLYHNLLEVNWSVDSLRNLALFGNSFESYEHHTSVIKDYVASDYTKRILVARSFTKEFRIATGPDDHCRAFYESSWHFFSPDPEQGLPSV